MATSTNYSVNGRIRRVDLYVMGALDFGSGDTQLTSPSMQATAGGRVCAGIVKLAQKVCIELLTYLPMSDLDWGTDIGLLVRQPNASIIRSSIGDTASAAVKKVMTDIIAEERAWLPDDERLLQVALLGWSIDNATQKIKIDVSVTNRNFESLPIVIPISIVP